MLGKWSTAALPGVLALLLSQRARAEEEVRIAIMAGRSSIEIAGEDLTVFDSETRERLYAARGESGLTIAAGRNGLDLRGKEHVPSKNESRHRIVVEARDVLRVGRGLFLGRVEVSLDTKSERLLVTNRLPLELYLLGIVGSEMSPEWPLEALKAQAVAARTYALQRRMMVRAADGPYDLESSVLSQVYKGADRIRPSVVRAVKETRGEVLSYRRGLVEALFHSTCGGQTRSAKSVFGRGVPYLEPQPCKWCRDSDRHQWQLSLPLRQVERSLSSAKLTRSKLRSFHRAAEDAGVHVREGAWDRTLSPRKVRAAVGYAVLYSDRFTATTHGNTVKIEGIGFGHGVGMCQWGARGMALAGKKHAEILEYYYAGASVKLIY